MGGQCVESIQHLGGRCEGLPAMAVDIGGCRERARPFVSGAGSPDDSDAITPFRFDH